MLEQSIQKIQETEAQAEQDKTACRAELQRMLAAAEADAAALIPRTESALKQELETLLAQTEQSAASAREEILRKAALECDDLRALAQANSEKAIRLILSKGV